MNELSRLSFCISFDEVRWIGQLVVQSNAAQQPIEVTHFNGWLCQSQFPYLGWSWHFACRAMRFLHRKAAVSVFAPDHESLTTRKTNFLQKQLCVAQIHHDRRVHIELYSAVLGERLTSFEIISIDSLQRPLQQSAFSPLTIWDVASISEPRSQGRLEAFQRLTSVSPRTSWRTPRSRLGLEPGCLGLGLGLVGLVHKGYFTQFAAAKSAIAYLFIVKICLFINEQWRH